MIGSYMEAGWSIIPVAKGSKVPAGKWAHAQSERASVADVHLWLAEGQNLGVVTGELSGVVVVDCDNADAVARVTQLGHEPTPTCLTGRGAHLYFRHPGQPVRNAVALEDGIDVRGDGGFCVIPPSIHPSGEAYRWATGLSLEDVAPAPCPAWLLASTQASQNVREPGEWRAAFAEAVGNGQRNQKCAELAGYLLRRNVEPGVVFELLCAWNERRCSPAMAASEVGQVVKSIALRDQRRRA